MHDGIVERRRVRRGRFRFGHDVLYGVLRFIGVHVRSFRGAVLASLLVGFGAGAGVGLFFLALARLVTAGATRRFDESVLRAVAALRTAWLDDAMLGLTTLGGTAVLFPLVAVTALLLWLTRHRFSAALLVVAVLGGALLLDLLKEFYGRPRPTAVLWGTEVDSASFPSGHAMASVIVYGSIAHLVARLQRRRSVRRTIWAVAVAIILLVGTSRVFLGVHYPSDVVAGYAAGLAWTVAVGAGFVALRFFAGPRPEPEPVERGRGGRGRAGRESASSLRAWLRGIPWAFLATGWALAYGVGLLFGRIIQHLDWWRAGGAWERAVLTFANRTVSPALDPIFLWLPLVGTNYTLAPIIALAAVWLWRRGRHLPALHLATVQLGSWLLNPALKFTLPRPRPDLFELRGQFAFPAYPSGHSIAVVSVLFTAAYLVRRAGHGSWAFWFVGAFYILNSWSRIYLSVHWPTDVIGGTLVGAIWLAVTILAFREVRPDG